MMSFRFHQGFAEILRVGVIATIWLVLIGSLHAYLNGEQRKTNKIIMGYMPVITNLAAPLIDAASKDSAVHFEAMKFGTFSEMGEAFKMGHIQVAFIIAPLSILLHQQGVPLKVVYIGNRHESTLVVRNDVPYRSLAEMKGMTIAVPIRFSGHNLAIRRYMRENGMEPGTINIVEVPPPDMPAALSTGALDGYFVGEPFAAKTLEAGLSRKLLDVESIWPKFMCNLMIVREDLIRLHPEWVETLVGAAVRSGLWARDHIDEAVKVACIYWGQDPKTATYAFTHPPGRVRFDLFTPEPAEFEEMADQMVLAGLIQKKPDLAGMIEDRFARAVTAQKIDSFQEILPR